MILKIFKKKKSDNKLSSVVTQPQKTTEIPILNPPKKPVPLVDPKIRPSTPPSIIMPKPRRLLTPTRAILGRFDNDKTQVEEEEQVSHDMISPILLPKLHHEQDIVLKKPIKMSSEKKLLQHVNSHSTSSSDNSSKLYESAQEYISDEDDTKFINLSSLSLLKNPTLDSKNDVSDSSSRTVTPRTRSHRIAVRSINSSATITPPHKKDTSYTTVLAAIPTTTEADVAIATAAVAAEYETNGDNNRAVHNDDTYINTAVDDKNTKFNDNVFNNNNSSNTPDLNCNGTNYTNRDVSNNIPVNNEVNFDDYVVDTNYNNGANQINDVNYNKPIAPNDSNQNKDTKKNKEVDYSFFINDNNQKQKEEQENILYQLKKQVEMMEKQRILDREEWCRKEQELLAHRQIMMNTLDETKQQLSNVLKSREENKAREIYYQQQLQQQQLQQMKKATSKQHISKEEDYNDDDDENSTELDMHQSSSIINDKDYDDRRIMKSKSEEYIKYNSRSSSRASYHRNQYYPQQVEEETRPISRRNSNASNKSYRLDPSPSATIVANPMTPRGRQCRPRAKSIETGNWNEGMPNMHGISGDYHDPSFRPRRSRSVGRKPTPRRHTMYYDDVEEDFHERAYYEDPRYIKAPARYGEEYYMGQSTQPPQPPQPLYGYYNQFQAPLRHQGARYGRRHYNHY